MSRRKKPTCFAIMPFGQKVVGNFKFDFEAIWRDIIEEAGERAGFRIIRADQGDEGMISPAMFRDLFEADAAIVDVTYANPNVYYELGIRHGLCPHGTVLIRWAGGNRGFQWLENGVWVSPPDAGPPVQKGFGWRQKHERRMTVYSAHVEEMVKFSAPFDLQDVRHIPYIYTEEEVERTVQELAGVLAERNNATEPDSPVHKHIEELKISTGSSPAAGRQDGTYELLGADGQGTGLFVGYNSGDIANLDVESGNAVDFWVNSENTMMQMARMYDRSVSAAIRYLGARQPDAHADGYDDTIQNALIAEMKGRQTVNPGDVLVTQSGKLEDTHGVKRVLHAASVVGRPTKGWDPISPEAMGECVRRIVRTVRDLNAAGVEGRSVIIPIFGAGMANREASDVVEDLVNAAISALAEGARDPQGRGLNLVLFSAFSRADVALMRRQFARRCRDSEKVLKSVVRGDAEAG